jgi:hypothetical protein
MELDVQYGDVTSISGFEQGPVNEAAINISWKGSCSGFSTVGHGMPFSAVETTCRVSFNARAWAYCPVGIKP